MQAFERIREYSKTVCNQIRWEKAHEPVLKEIEDHIMDQRDAYIADGVSETEATENAIRQMGDPIVVGTQLDRTHRPKAQWDMLILTMAMVFMGVGIRGFLLPDAGNSSITGIEIFSILTGMLLMLIAYFSDFTLIGKYPKTVFSVIVVMTIIIIKTSPVLNGRAYYATSMSLLFPLAFVAIVYATRNRGYFGIILCGISFAILSLTTIAIPSAAGVLNLGLFVGIIFLNTMVTNWFSVKSKIGYLVVGFLTLLPLSIWVLQRNIVLSIRLEMLFNYQKETMGEHYVVRGVSQMISSSKLIGHSTLSADIIPVGFQIPNLSTDYLLTYLIYNYGWITFVGIMGILTFFIIKGFRLAIKQKSRLGLWVSLAIMMTYTVQVVGYVLWNLGIILIAPMTLPFISYGNGAVIINLILVGIMLSVFRTGDMFKDKSCKPIQSKKLIDFEDGKLRFNLRRREQF